MKKIERESNFELLRILSIIMIIFHHIFVHVINNQLANFKPLMTFYVVKRLCVCEIANSFGPTGNAIFLLLSGYFLIDKKINISKQISKLLTQMLFVVTFLVITTSIYNCINPITVEVFFSFNLSYWFVGYYIFVIFIGWIFINKKIETISQQMYISILFVTFAFVSVGYLQNMLNSLKLSNMICGIFCYLLGGYIKKYNPFKKIKFPLLIFVLALSIFCICLDYYQNNTNVINNAIKTNLTEYTISFTTFNQNDIFCILNAIILFEIFKRVKIKNSNFINYISAATFSIYLTHESTFFYYLIKYKFNWEEKFYNNQYCNIVINISLIILSVLVIGVLLYTIYNLLFKLLSKYIILNDNKQ